MPIVSKKPTAAPDYRPHIPKIESEKTKSVVVDTKYTPRSSLLKYTEGAIWTVNYYSQYHDRDNATYSQDPGQSPIYQQYRKIEQLELRVDSALATDQDPESKAFTVKGTAYIPLSIIPNEGDMFAADVGDGRLGVFQVDNSEKKSIFKESVYYIQYTMLYYTDQEPDRYKDLESKVVHNLHYVKEFAQYGQHALITTDRYKTLTEITHASKRLKYQYYEWFFSNEYSTLILPDQDYSVYDPHVTKVMTLITSVDDHYCWQRVRRLNTEDDNRLKRDTIWNALLKRDKQILSWCEKKYTLASTAGFTYDPLMEGIRYSGIHYVVYPKSINEAIDDKRNRLYQSSAAVALKEGYTLNGNTVPLVTDNTVTHLGKQMTIAPLVTVDDYYVLSGAFYDNIGEKSLLEVLVENYLQREANHPELVLKLIHNSWKLGSLQRFYYIPILLILATNIIKNIN